MSQDIYTINSHPGVAGYLVSGIINRHYLEAGRESIRSGASFDEEPPAQISDDWFYSHWSIDTATTATQIIDIPHLPNYDNVSTKYPNAKQIIITFSVEDTFSIAAAEFQHRYVHSWDQGIWVDVLRNILTGYPKFFPNPNVAPSEMTAIQTRTLLSILQNATLLSGFHNLEVPTDNPNIIEIKYGEIVYKPSVLKAKLASIIGEPLQPAAVTDYRGFMQSYHTYVYERYKYTL